jgi:hypothetical protein
MKRSNSKRIKRLVAIVAAIVSFIMLIFSLSQYIEDDIRRGRKGRRRRQEHEITFFGGFQYEY